MSFTVELPWKTNRQLAAAVWTRCMEAVLPYTTHWYVDMILPQRFASSLTDSVRPAIVNRYPQLLEGLGTWKAEVTPEEVRQFIQGWTAEVDGEPAWSLDAHLVRCHLLSGNKLLAASEEFASQVDMYPVGVADEDLIAEIRGMGLPAESIY